jgi:dipeptidyl aminopeptidase/acylaminoacyl peptidase
LYLEIFIQPYTYLMKRIFVLLIVIVLSGQVNIFSQSFSLADILSSSMPTDLTISGDNRVAWVENKAGVRNIWLATGPEYDAVKVTNYLLDDGQEISRLIFSPDEKMLYFIRGGAPNGRGEYPNPNLQTAGTDRAIWVVDLATKKVRKIAKGSSHVLSPDGKTLLFVQSAKAYAIDATDAEAKSKNIINTRGRATSLKWSPDGKKMLFQSNRGDHSFIGVFSFSDSTLIYIDPTVDHDRQPVWSPDSKQIAFIRMPNEADRLPFTPKRSALPWSIRVANANTGMGEEIWRAKEGLGSAFRSISASNQLMWAVTNEIVFPYEGDGWTHLYSVNAATKKVNLLTPGTFEVQFVALSEEGKEVVYSSNQDDIDRQHVWEVTLPSGKPKLVTPGNGVEWSPRMSNNGTMFYFASGARVPAHIEMIKTGGNKKTVLHPESIPPNFPNSKSLVVPEQVIFSAADGMQIHGQLFVPKDSKKGEKHPALLFFHGGSRRQMMLGFHHRGYYHNAYSMNQYLASQGYVVLSVNYRSGIGYGMEFREALNYGARGASEFNDVLGAGIFLQNRSDVDAAKIGLWGGSYGGFLTAMGLAKASDMFAAGVDLHGVHDWNIVIRNFAPTYDAGKNAAASKLAFDSSPMAYVDTWRSPVLLIQGDDDRNVPFSETVHIVESLRRQGVEFEQLIFPDEVHGFLLYKNWLKAYEATVDFFDRKLK